MTQGRALTQNTAAYFEVFSTLPRRKNKPLKLLMCKNGLCMKILFVGVGHVQISLKWWMPSENKAPKGLFSWQNFRFSHLSQEKLCSSRVRLVQFIVWNSTVIISSCEFNKAQPQQLLNSSQAFDLFYFILFIYMHLAPIWNNKNKQFKELMC